MYVEYDETRLAEINKIFSTSCIQGVYEDDELNYWAGAYYWKELKNLCEAKKYFRIASKNHNFALYNLAEIHREENNYGEAKYLCGIGIARGFTMMYTCLGYLYFREGDYDAALRNLYIALTNNKKCIDITSLILGYIYEAQGDDEKAIIYYQMAADNGSKSATNLIGRIHHAIGNDELAEEFFTRAATKYDDIEGVLNLGLLSYERCNTKDTKKYWLEVIEKKGIDYLVKIDPEYVTMLGQIYFEEDDKIAAQKYWEIAAKYNNENAKSNLAFLRKQTGLTSFAKKN